MRKHIRPFLARFGVKLLTEVAPAALASVVGGLIFSQVIRTEPPKPAPVAIQPAGAEMLALLREEHTLIADLVKKDVEARLAANKAADEDADKLRMAAADRARFAQNLAQAKTASPSPKLAAKELVKEPRQQLTQLVKSAARDEALSVGEALPVGQPLQLLSMQVDPNRPRPPADLAAYQPPLPRKQEDGFLKRQVRGVISTVERVPSLLRDAADWVVGGVTPPKLPSLPQLPSRDFLKAQM